MLHVLFHLFLFSNLLLKLKIREVAWPVGTCNLLYCTLASDVLGRTGQISITAVCQRDNWKKLNHSRNLVTSS